MQPLSQDDLQKFSDCLQELYKTCSIEDFSSRLLVIIEKVISAVDYTYMTLSFKQHNATVMDYQPASGVDPLDTESFEQIAHQHFYENPLAVNYIRTRDNGAHKVSDFLNEQQLHRLEGLYGKYMQPRGLRDLIALSLPIPPTTFRNSLLGEQGDVVTVMLMGDQIYTERDRFILNLLHPHLLQAQQNVQQFTQIQQDWIQQRHTLDTLGIIALNGDGKVKFLSRQAGHWLKQYFQDSNGSTSLPDHLQRWVSYQLSLTTSNNQKLTPHLPLKLEQEGQQLVIRFVTEQPREQYLLLLEEQQSLISSVALEWLGLTKREAEVLFEVTQGKTNLEIAETLSLSVGTVRKYLEYIYSKLGAQTRAEAIVYALKQLGVLH